MQGEVQARRVALEATVDLKKRPLDLSETRTLEELQELKKEHELHRRRQKERRREERRLQLQRRLEKRAKKGLAGRERGAGGAAGGASEGQRSGMTEHAGKSEIEELRETLLDELRKPRKRRVLEPDSRIDWTLFEGFQVYTQRDVGQRLGKLRRQKRQERAAKRAAQFAEESGAVPLTPPDFSMPDVDHADLWWELELPRQSARASLRGGPRRRPKRKSLGLGAGLGLGTSEDRAIRALQQLVQWRQSEDRAAADLAEAVEVDIEVIEVQPQPTRPGAPSEEAEAQAVASAGEPDSAIAEPEAKGTKAEASAPALAERTRRAREKYRVALEKFSKSERRNEIEWFLMQRIEPQSSLSTLALCEKERKAQLEELRLHAEWELAGGPEEEERCQQEWRAKVRQRKQRSVARRGAARWFRGDRPDPDAWAFPLVPEGDQAVADPYQSLG